MGREKNFWSLTVLQMLWLYWTKIYYVINKRHLTFLQVSVLLMKLELSYSLQLYILNCVCVIFIIYLNY